MYNFSTQKTKAGDSELERSAQVLKLAHSGLELELSGRILV